MKRLFILSILLFTSTIFAQERCGTTQYMQMIESNNPEIAAKRIKLEKDIQKWITENPDYHQSQYFQKEW